MTSPILFVGGEDISFENVGGAWAASQVGTNVTFVPDTTSGHFRSGYGRHALTVPSASAGGSTCYLKATIPSSSSFWFSGRCWLQTGSNPGSGAIVWQLFDSGGAPRLRMRNTGSTASGPFVIETVNSSGTATQVGGTLSGGFSDATINKIDVNVNYATSGGFNVYINGTLAVTYAGDITTNSVTALTAVGFGQLLYGFFNTQQNSWSEIIVSTSDSRSMSVVTQAPSALGLTGKSATGAVNASTATVANTFALYQKITAGLSGVLTSIEMTFSAVATGNLKYGLYTDTGSQPGTLLATSATIVNPAVGVVVAAVSAGPTLVAGTNYWVAVAVDANMTALQAASGASAEFSNGFAFGTFFQSTAPSVAGSTGFPVYAGFTVSADAWTSAAFGNVSATLANDAAPDYSTTAGQIERYQVSPGMPAGSFSVVSVVQHLRAAKGASGPSKIDMISNLAGVDYFSSDLSPGTAFGLLAVTWELNPATSAAWTTANLPGSSNSYNLGYRSVT